MHPVRFTNSYQSWLVAVFARIANNRNIYVRIESYVVKFVKFATCAKVRVFPMYRVIIKLGTKFIIALFEVFEKNAIANTNQRVRAFFSKTSNNAIMNFVPNFIITLYVYDV